MNKIPVFDSLLNLGTTGEKPLYQQLYDALRRSILDGQIRPGQRLPASRVLAQTLGVSRSTVVSAFEQLLAEGYLEGVTGAGTFVCDTLPDNPVIQVENKELVIIADENRPGLSKRGNQLSTVRLNPAFDPPEVRPFQSGVPALEVFPHTIWGRIVARNARHRPKQQLAYQNAAGYRPLREAVATYLRTSRAVRCEADQVIILNGAQQGLDLVARVLLDPGDQAWIEDPGYLGVRAALQGAGIKPVPVPVNEFGLEVAYGKEVAPDARLVYATPSHQYPMGAVMCVTRRLELLEWASQSKAWILEDDYDSEYRYDGRPLASLQGLDTHQRVLYLGTFSKVLYPSLRLGYLVVPPDLVDAFCAARAVLDRHSSWFEQTVLHAFIEEGHLGRHIRRMRMVYRHRQEVLVDAAQQYLSDWLEVRPSAAGLHVVGWLSEGADDQAISRAIMEAGLTAPPLSAYRMFHPCRPGLVLGYAGYTETQIRQGVLQLAKVMV